ncbi:MAG TPA: hypothetical protein VLV25_06690 [Steroidobacteraceae bacterium]|nr:hypothetical protein [Steroidobacteraceae bacterium]
MTATVTLFDAAQAPAPASELHGRLLPAPPGWPAPPGPAAYHGLLGEIVRRLEPETEADPVAIIAQLLVAFGAAVGRGAYFQVEATRHHPQEFLLLVGDSSTSRKGTSWDHARRLIATADATLDQRILTGLVSGEGLVWAVRDPTSSDAGVPDRRLLAFEAEFASALKAATRENSTLSPTLRSAWDGRPLQLLTRTTPARASDAHITVVGHITAAELRHHLTGLELANGLANRFLLISCRRTRLLPEGGASDPLAGTGLLRVLAGAIEHARTAGRVRLDKHARELWHHAYIQLAHASQTGIAGALCARAEAHTIRLALLYALSDGERQINTEHLQAALSLWDYAARSATWALQSATGDPLAEQIHTALTNHPAGLTRSQISDTLQHNQPAKAIQRALDALALAGRANCTQVHTAGRPAELWTATTRPIA